jgi:protein required for attachment to host cells
MVMTMRPPQWVVVCDGAKALIFENAGTRLVPKLRAREVYEQDVPPTSAQGTDAPGRTHSSVGEFRSAVEQTDWHHQAERAFLAELAGRLDAAVIAGEAQGLVVVAPPRALGMLRQAYSPHVRAAVRAEIDKDYVKLPAYEIEKRLAA